MMKLSKRGLDLIKGFESFVPYVYDDLLPPVRGKYREWDGGPVRGTLTIGYGHTNSAKHSLRISQGLRITEKQAREILDVDLDECEEDVRRLVEVPLTQGKYDALTSFDFNCGAGNLAKLVGPLNRGDYEGTRAKFDLFVHSKGKRMRGLQRRRDAEQSMWDATYGDDVVSIGIPDDPPIDIPTEPVHHPEQVDPPKPLPPTDWEKLFEKIGLVAPLITAFGTWASWQVAAVIASAGIITLLILIYLKRTRA